MNSLAVLRTIFPPAVVAKFASVGLLTTLLTFVLIVVTKSVFGWSDQAANFAGYVVGLIISYALNKRWTFNKNNGTWRVAGRFLLVFGIAYAINLAAVLGLIKLGLNAYIAHLAGMPFYTAAYYLGCRLYAFR